MRMIEFLPSCAEAIRPPFCATSKQHMGAECPKKNRFCSPVSTSMAISEPHEVNRTIFSLARRDHFNAMQFAGEYPIMCLSSMIGS